MSSFLYVIGSHTNPAQVIRLVRRIKGDSPDSHILVHHDATKAPLDQSATFGFPGVHYIPNPLRATWGSFAFVEAALKCIEFASAKGINYNWLVFISGQDYPSRPLSEFENHVTMSGADGFLEHNAVLKQNWRGHLHDDITRRYCYRYIELPEIFRFVIGPIARVLRVNFWQSWVCLRTYRACRIGFRRRKVPFSSSFQCYKGSSWFTLSRRCIEYVGWFVQNNPQFVEYYKRTANPDESFFQTILLNSKQFDFVNNNLIYKRFVGGAPSPDVLRSSDFDVLKKSANFFARKVDLKADPVLLDLLDAHSSQHNALRDSGP